MLSAELNEFIKDHENDDIPTLLLHATQYPGVDIRFAINQITGRQTIKNKVPSWYVNEQIIYPKQLSLEQSSSEQTALYKASLFSGNKMIDLTGGMGIDSSFLSANFKQAVYVEEQKGLTEIASHNFKVLGLNNITVINTDAISYLEEIDKADLIYIDPARRDTKGRKTVQIEDCTPNIIDIQNILRRKADRVMIKLSPMLDITLGLKHLSDISEVHIVSYNNECKELLFIKNTNYCRTIYYCVNIQKEKTDILSFIKEQEEEISINYTDRVEAYLYEPNASIIKAGAYKYIASHYNIKKLHPNSHLYTSDTLIPDFQGRTFIIESTCSLGKNEIKELRKRLNQANITTRNFPISVNELRKKTGLKEGGSSYIFATTLANDKKILITSKKVN